MINFDPYGFRTAAQLSQRSQEGPKYDSPSSSPGASSSNELGQLEKAKLVITPKDKRILKGNPPTSYTFQFNPEQLKMSRGIDAESNDKGGRDGYGYKRTSFSGPKLGTLNISNIMIDTYESNVDLLSQHIAYLKKMVQLYQVGWNRRRKRAPIYYFTWGKIKYLKCFVSSLDYEFTMFKPNGAPVQATVTMKLQEIRDVFYPTKK